MQVVLYNGRKAVVVILVSLLTLTLSVGIRKAIRLIKILAAKIYQGFPNVNLRGTSLTDDDWKSRQTNSVIAVFAVTVE